MQKVPFLFFILFFFRGPLKAPGGHTVSRADTKRVLCLLDKAEGLLTEPDGGFGPRQQSAVVPWVPWLYSGWRRRRRSSSAADAHPDGHEGAKRPAALHHGLPNASHQLPAPHPDPETGERPKHGSCCHSHCEAHHEAHLDPIKAAGLGLAVRTYSHRHLRLFCSDKRRCCFSPLWTSPVFERSCV